jgi:hypothetical protein
MTIPQRDKRVKKLHASHPSDGNAIHPSPGNARPPLPSRLKRRLVMLGIYGLTHDHSRLWIPAICTIIKERRWSHA